MYDERTPLREERRPAYSSPYRRYNKMGIINFLSCLVLGILAASLFILTIVYFKLDDEPDFPPGIVNDTIALSLTNDNITDDEIRVAFKLAQNDLVQKENLDRKNPMVQLNTPSYKHQQVFKGENGTYELSKKGYLLNRATKYLMSTHLQSSIINIESDNWLELTYCAEVEGNCMYRYRKMDGSCNNKKHQNKWGVAMTPFVRALPSDYCDGIETPRCSKDKEPLPSPRIVSVNLHRPEYKSDPTFTYMFAVWGQFLDHDISSTALNKGVDGQYLSCCGDIEHPECYPVNVSSDDPFYSKFGIDCMEFVRSAPAPTCQLGPREQLNQVTSYLDGSVVYGSSNTMANRLREFTGGRMKMFRTKDGRDLLPISTDLKDGCNREEQAKQGKYCFISGDSRSNENLHLTTLHLIMARQHNRLASNLSVLNPDWDDEKIYQESRRIVIAQMQHITYTEFLQPLLGEEIMNKYKLKIDDDYEYNDEIDASLNNNFAAAAFRFAHTLIPKMMKITSNDSMTPELIELHKILFNPFRLYDVGSLEAVINGAINTKTDKLDRFFNTEMTQHLFEENKNTTDDKTCGLDLVTLNLQRGRDHGLPSYVHWRKYCKLSQANTFSDLEDIMDNGSVDTLKKYYKNVEDIDLYSGALSEKPLPNAILGPTATCLIAEQFYKIKHGDRYWYETKEKPHAFTKGQLKEIKKTTLAKLLCDNSDSLQTIRKHVMKTMDDMGEEMECNKLDEIDLQLWSRTEMEMLSLRSDKGPGTVKNSVSFSLITGEVYGSFDNGESVKLFDGTIPAEIYTDNFTDPSSFDVSASVDVFAVINDENTITGTFSIPLAVRTGPNPGIKYWKGNFTYVIQFKWGGSFGILQSNKNYKCKLSFTAFHQESVLQSKSLKQLGAAGGDDCKIMLTGKFYKKPFICYLTPWFCTDAKIYYWNGEAKLVIPQPAPPNTIKSEANTNKPGQKQKMMLKAEPITVEPKLSKGYASITVINGEVTGNVDGEKPMNVFNGNFPVSINTDIFVNSNPYDVKTYIEWEGEAKTNETIIGSFSLPIHNNGTEIKSWKGQFSVNIKYKWGGSISIVEPHKVYKCKIIFVPSRLLTSDNKLMSKKTESCTMILTGEFSGKIFQWGGDIELMLLQPMNELKLSDIMNKPIMLSKTDDNEKPEKPDKPPKPIKLYASVAIDGGEIFGSYDGGEAMNLFNGVIPTEVYYENFTDPNSYDVRVDIEWEGIATENKTATGTWMVPVIVKDGTSTSTKYWKGNFTASISALKAGSLDVIEPNKKYKCKLMFTAFKKSTLLGKTDPSAESCTIMVSGWFYSKPLYCLITPWWCTDDKIYYWDGGLELILRKPVPVNNLLLEDLNSYSWEEYDLDHSTYLNLHAHTIQGKVISGSANIYKTDETIYWDGNLPVDIRLPIFWQPNPDMSALDDNFSNGITLTCSFFQSTIKGTFKLPQYTKYGSVNWATGKFSFELSPIKGGTLYDFMIPDVEYTSRLHFHDSDEKMPVLFQDNLLARGQGMNMTIIALGKHKLKSRFLWNGKFVIIVNKIPYIYRLI